MNARQRGVGLVEILVALVLLSIGFLAVARMQITGLRFSQSAQHRSQAAFLAAEMIDRMRGNIDGVLAGAYDDLSTSAELSDPGCHAKACDAAEIARQDLRDWSTALYPDAGDSAAVPVLPTNDDTAPVGRVERLGPGLYRVSVSWVERIEGESHTQSLSMSFLAETRG